MLEGIQPWLGVSSFGFPYGLMRRTRQWDDEQDGQVDLERLRNFFHARGAGDVRSQWRRSQSGGSWLSASFR